MKPEQIAKSLSLRGKGQLYSVLSRRPVKTRKGVSSIIEKESSYQGILAEYSARKSVKEGIQSGERDRPQLPNGMKECFYLGESKFFRGFNGTEYLGVTISGNKPKSKYYKNGAIVEKDEIISEVLAAEVAPKKSKEQLAENCQAEFVLIKCDNILRVG